MGTGLPLCEHVKTASEPRVTTQLGVMTEVIVGIAVGKTTTSDNSDISVHRQDHFMYAYIFMDPSQTIPSTLHMYIIYST